MEKMINTREKSRIIVACGMFTALIAAGAFIKIPVPVVPFTLQFLFTMLAGALLGGKAGAISVGIYILLGLLGLPIFTEGGGFWYIAKPSFGYILGFAIASYVTGTMIEKAKRLTMGTLLTANFIGLAIVYSMGMAYYYFICNVVLHTPIGVGALFLYCFVLAVPGDIALCILAAILTKRIRPIIARL